MFVSLLLTFLSVHSTLAASTSVFVLESNGVVYIPGDPIPKPTNFSGRTNGEIGSITSSDLNVTSNLRIASIFELSATSGSASRSLGPSVSSTFSTASVPKLFRASSKKESSVSAILNNVAANTAPTSNPSIPSGLGLTSAVSTPSIAGTPATSSNFWPASITYVAQSSSSDVVGVAFITTVNGTSKITTTQPQQSLIPPTVSGSVYSLIAITEGGTTTTLTLNTLPTATLPSEPTGAQIVTQSGIPIIYSPITLSGYSNTEPVEISTTFVETVDGHTTTQGGWYVMFPTIHFLGSPWPSLQISQIEHRKQSRRNIVSLNRILTSASSSGG